ncbi:MAG: DUF4249 domain-containing protein [Cyclobacteriaceae bacterium]
MKTSFWLLLPLIALTSCLQEIDVNLESDQPTLVVEGYINDQVETYTVKLSTLSDLRGAGSNTLGQNAAVEVEDPDGARWQFAEVSPGIYELAPGSLQGEIGKSYQLFITLENGEEYQSSVERIPPKVNTVGGEAVFIEEFIEQQNGTTARNIRHDIIITIENQPEQQFYIVENQAWAEVEIGYGDCFFGSPAGPSICWSFRESISDNAAIIGTNVNLGSDTYKTQAISVPFDSKLQYIAIIKVNSMSPTSYSFWQSVNDQLQRDGGIFDRPLAPIVGNIVNTTNNTLALGYFHAYSSSEEIICFDRSEVQGTVNIVGPIPCPVLCTSVWAPATFNNVAELLCQ